MLTRESRYVEHASDMRVLVEDECCARREKRTREEREKQKGNSSLPASLCRLGGGRSLAIGFSRFLSYSTQLLFGAILLALLTVDWPARSTLTHTIKHSFAFQHHSQLTTTPDSDELPQTDERTFSPVYEAAFGTHDCSRAWRCIAHVSCHSICVRGCASAH